jgi:hypothetical protein
MRHAAELARLVTELESVLGARLGRRHVGVHAVEQRVLDGRTHVHQWVLAEVDTRRRRRRTAILLAARLAFFQRARLGVDEGDLLLDHFLDPGLRHPCAERGVHDALHAGGLGANGEIDFGRLVRIVVVILRLPRRRGDWIGLDDRLGPTAQLHVDGVDFGHLAVERRAGGIVRESVTGPKRFGFTNQSSALLLQFVHSILC